MNIKMTNLSNATCVPRIASLALLSICALGTILPGNTLASEWNGYPGSICQEYYPGDTSLYKFSTMIYNLSNKTTYVTCPIVRHGNGNSNWSKFNMVISNGSYQKFQCTLNDHNGWTGKGSSRTSYTYTRGTSILYGSVGTAAGQYTLTCNLPPYSGIYSFGITEY